SATVPEMSKEGRSTILKLLWRFRLRRRDENRHPGEAGIHVSVLEPWVAMGPGFRRDDGKESTSQGWISFACSRNAYFCTLPVEVFGNGPNTPAFGTL